MTHETRTYLVSALGSPKSLKKRPFRRGQTIYEMASVKMYEFYSHEINFEKQVPEACDLLAFPTSSKAITVLNETGKPRKLALPARIERLPS